MGILDGDTEADVIKLFINEGLAIAGSKPQQLVIAPDTKRILVIDSSGTSIEIGISDDSKLVLKEGAQDIAGLKTFDGGIIINSSFVSNALATFQAGIVVNSSFVSNALATFQAGISVISSFVSSALATFQAGIIVQNSVADFQAGATIAISLDVSTMARFNSLRMSKFLSAPSGGTNEGNAPDIDTADNAEIIVNPSGSNTFYNINVAPAGKFLFVKNVSETVTATIGTAANMIALVPSTVLPLKAKIFSSDGGAWWPVD